MLSQEGQDIVLIDQAADKLKVAANQVDAATIKGTATSYSVLEEAGVSIVADQGADGSESKFCWNVTITGPAKYIVKGEERDSPYGGKQFHLEVQFPDRYPFKAPVVCVF